MSTQSRFPTPEIGRPIGSDWIGATVRNSRMLSSNEVSHMLGYRSRSAFWSWVAKEQPPHVRISKRNIRFPAAELQAWLDRRSNTKGAL
jgi:predicted DNA-binding transcriptional regulator AlpA